VSTEAAAYTTLGLILAVAAAWSHAWWARGRYEDRRAALRAERAARPPGPHPAAIHDEITLAWHALGHACCLRQWETAGREHDPDRCTRKDQTT
jgi:hypothetical protein